MIETTTQNEHPSEKMQTANNEFTWHLQDIRHFENELYEDGTRAPEAKVGIIDTGCDTAHPCLKNCEISEIDFAVFEQGGTYGKDMDEEHAKREASSVDMNLALARLDISDKEGTSPSRSMILNLVDDFSRANPRQYHYPIENPAHRYGYHGVACAGLIAAHKPDHQPDTPPGVTVSDTGLRGILPGCSLVCVSTPFGYDLKPIIRALLYCVASEVDVILIPRGIFNHSSVYQNGSQKVSTGDHSNTQPMDTDNNKIIESESATLDWLLEQISEKIPLVVASGNSGLSHPEYPANPKWESMIIVGAHNARGRLSSYTSGRKGTLTVTAPSDDDETIHQDSVRQFETEKTAPAINISNILLAEPTHASSRSVVSLDTVSHLKPRLTDDSAYGDLSMPDGRNRWKNSSGPAPGYQYFGGTSAASSLVAGAVAYIQAYNRSQKGRALSVEEVRKLLAISVSEKTSVPRLDILGMLEELATGR